MGHAGAAGLLRVHAARPMMSRTMPRRGKGKKPAAPPAADEKPVAAAPAFRPFADVAAALKTVDTSPATKKPEPPPKAPAEMSEEEEKALFEASVRGVRPLARRERVTPPVRQPASTASRWDEDAETLSKLAAMVDGSEPLGAEFSEEHAEWISEEADPGILPRLVAGEFAWQEHVDLHGMTREQAHAAIYRFLAGARVKHLRCVLIVHGRGNHSEGQIPVLKLALQRWLQRAPIKEWVFAWATSRPVDGGPGAMYVLLRD